MVGQARGSDGTCQSRSSRGLRAARRNARIGEAQSNRTANEPADRARARRRPPQRGPRAPCQLRPARRLRQTRHLQRARNFLVRPVTAWTASSRDQPTCRTSSGPPTACTHGTDLAQWRPSIARKQAGARLGPRPARSALAPAHPRNSQYRPLPRFRQYLNWTCARLAKLRRAEQEPHQSGQLVQRSRSPKTPTDATGLRAPGPEPHHPCDREGKRSAKAPPRAARQSRRGRNRISVAR
jgi:hypothetical protein